mmetsp:Transcript_910/g.1431  ORF Transcript_910/g.1431 Transcript_910/m.1431 type:complete len:603 (-) Transcript_910:12-1820(-)
MKRPHTATGYRKSRRSTRKIVDDDGAGWTKRKTFGRRRPTPKSKGKADNMVIIDDNEYHDKENWEPVFNDEWKDTNLQSQYHEYAILKKLYSKKKNGKLERDKAKSKMLLEKCDMAFYHIYKNGKEKYPDWFEQNKGWLKQELVSLDNNVKKASGTSSTLSKEKKQDRKDQQKRKKDAAVKKKKDAMVAAGRARAKRSQQQKPKTKGSAQQEKIKQEQENFKAGQAFNILCRILMRMNQIDHRQQTLPRTSDMYIKYDKQYKNIVFSIEGLYQTYPDFELMQTFLSRFMYARFKDSKKTDINQKLQQSLKILKSKSYKTPYDEVAYALSLDLKTKLNCEAKSKYAVQIREALERATISSCQLAYYYLGHFTGKGLYVPADQEKAKRYFKMGALDNHMTPGYPFAQYEYGLMLKKGSKGEDANYVGALRMFKTASQHGLRKAALQLGQMYLYGLGCDQDYDRAISYLRDPAAAKDALAAYYLGECFRNVGDMDQALIWYEQAADLGMSRAQHKIDLYLKNENIDNEEDDQFMDDEEDGESQHDDEEDEDEIELIIEENKRLIEENEILREENEQYESNQVALEEQILHLTATIETLQSRLLSQ